MSVKVSNEQLLEAMKLLGNLKKFVDKGFGKIDGVMILTNNLAPDKIFIKYEKTFLTAGEMDYENRIVEISRDGNIDFIDNKFKDIFERSAFISECKRLNLDNKDSYTIISNE